MSFAREKRLLVGWLALVAPVPLPFNEILEWPVLWLYLVLVLVFLRRAHSDRGRSTPLGWLPAWAMNVLGLAYLPVLYMDFLTRWSGQLVRPVTHLAMFAVVVKLFSLKREKDKWQTLFGVFFLFLAAMATSVHPAVLLYVIAFVTLTLILLTRFSLFSVLARFGYRDWALQKVPLTGFIVTTTLLSVVVSIPLFALLPRVKSPFIMGRGTGTGTVIRASGFSDQVSLDTIGSIRQSREVALRMAFEPENRKDGEIRLKAATYEQYDGRSWLRSAGREHLTSNGPGTFTLATTPSNQWASVFLQPLRSRSLPLPSETSEVEIRASVLVRDHGGAISMLFPPSQIVEYKVALASSGDVALADPPNLDDPAEPTLDLGGVSPAIRDYANRIAGSFDGFDRLRVLELHLSEGDFTYTTDRVGRGGQSPIEEFLLTTREGHCEYFASSLVMMLRSQGVPARLVTGFLGAEASRFENYYVVRQSNAHAWVEAYLPEIGWQTLDPTPASGRPGVETVTFRRTFGQVWDYLSFRWDRYVLTFGFYDQYQIASRLRALWRSWFDSRKRDKPAESSPIEIPVEVSDAVVQEGAVTPTRSLWILAIVVLLSTALGVSIAWWRTNRRPLTPTRAYLRLRSRLSAAGLQVPDSLAPLAFQQRAVGRFPDLGSQAEKVTHWYLRESYGPDGSEIVGAEELADSLAQIEEVLKRAG